MQKAILCFRDYQGKDLISGISNGQNVTSHANLNGANDFNGRGPNDRVDLLAPYDCKVAAISRADNTVLFESIGTVETPTGFNECWFLCSHMLDKDWDLLGIEIGKTFKQGEPCYTEGYKNAYNADMGNHIHMEQGIGRHNGDPSPYYKSSDTYTYNGVVYNTYYPNINGYECPVTDMLFLPYGVEKIEGISTIAQSYIWQYTDRNQSDDDQSSNDGQDGGNDNMITKDENKGVYGVDLSTYDKDTIDWEKLAKQAKFAILRCGYGADKDGQHDDTFFDFCKKCDEYGIKKGAYIYSYAETEQEAINEANHIIRLCNEAGGDFPIGLFLDMEDKLQNALSAETNTKNVLAYINQIWTTPYKAGFYSMQSFMNNKVDMSQIVGNAIVWVANFGVNDGYYHDITTNFEYDIRQYTSINADKDFSSRSGLDQNLHFAYDAYIQQPDPTPDPDPEEPEMPQTITLTIDEAKSIVESLESIADKLKAKYN